MTCFPEKKSSPEELALGLAGAGSALALELALALGAAFFFGWGFYRGVRACRLRLRKAERR